VSDRKGKTGLDFWRSTAATFGYPGSDLFGARRHFPDSDLTRRAGEPKFGYIGLPSTPRGLEGALSVAAYAISNTCSTEEVGLLTDCPGFAAASCRSTPDKMPTRAHAPQMEPNASCSDQVSVLRTILAYQLVQLGAWLLPLLDRVARYAGALAR